MSDLTNEMIDAAWDAYDDEAADSGIPSMQVRSAVAAALRVLADHLGPQRDGTLRAYGAGQFIEMANEIDEKHTVHSPTCAAIVQGYRCDCGVA